MDRNQFLKKIMNEEMKGLTHEDTFEFSCNICGNCCKNRQDILLSSYDVYRMSKYLNITPFELIDKYCDRYIGGDSKLPLASIRFKKIDNLGKPYTVCPFLKHKDGLLKCTVHDAKPVVCAVFPLGRAIKVNDGKRAIAYYVQDVCCGGEKSSQTVKQWLESFSILDSEEAFIEFSNFVSRLYGIINLKKLNEDNRVPEKFKESFYCVLVNFMYLMYDTNKPFMEQYKANIKSICEIAEELVDMLYKLGIDVKGSNFKK